MRAPRSDIGRIDYDHTSNYMAFRTNASERMRITSAGDVGIGITAPEQTLHVALSNSTGSVSAKIENTAAAATNSEAALQLQSNGTDNLWQIRAIQSSATSNDGELRFSLNGVGNFMSIHENGNVGIGTVSPGFVLDIGTDTAEMSFSSSTGTKVISTGGATNLQLNPGGILDVAVDLVCTTCINTTDIATSTGSFASAGGCSGAGCAVGMNDYGFFPKFEIDDCTGAPNPYSLAILGSNVANDTVAYVTLTNNGAACAAGTFDVRWRYITASDRGRIWVAVDDITGEIVAVWESDDPANQSDPLDTSVPIEIPGATTFNVAIPNMGQVQALMNALDVDQRGRARAALVAKLNGRGWTTGAVDESDLTSVPARFQDSARLAGLRVVADELGIVPAELVFEFMRFLSGPERLQWKANLGNVIDAHMIARSQ